MAVFRVAYRRWLDEEAGRGLVPIIHEVLAGLGDLVGPAGPGMRDPLPERAASAARRSGG